MKKLLLIIIIVLCLSQIAGAINYYGVNPSKWGGLGINLISLNDTNEKYDGWVDTLIANGFTEFRECPTFQNHWWYPRSKANIIRNVGKGAKYIWGVSSNSFDESEYTITAINWSEDISSTVDSTADTTHFIDDALTGANDYINGCYFYNITRSLGSTIKDFVANTDTVTLDFAIDEMTAGDSYTIIGFKEAILIAAQWAQDNGVFEFQIGNEEEFHVDGSTMTEAQIIINLKAVATEVQEIFTNGNVSYSTTHENISDWITAGKGDLDILASNVYMGGTEFDDAWKTKITNLVNEFGVGGACLTEFAPSYASLDDYSEDEAVQATAVTEMINYIKGLGMTRAFFFCWKNEPSSTFGVVKDNESYRLLWWSLLNSS